MNCQQDCLPDDDIRGYRVSVALSLKQQLRLFLTLRADLLNRVHCCLLLVG